LTVLTIGLLALGGMQISSIRGNDTAWEFTEGSTRAADRIEGLMGFAYDDSAVVDGTATQEKYTINWIVTPSDPVPNVKKITMVVSWTDQGKAKTFTADYYRAIDF